MVCPKCGADNANTNRFCLRCGTPLATGLASPIQVTRYSTPGSGSSPSGTVLPSGRRTLRQRLILIGLGLFGICALAAAAAFIIIYRPFEIRDWLLVGQPQGNGLMTLSLVRLSGSTDSAVELTKQASGQVFQVVRSDAGSTYRSEFNGNVLGGFWGALMPGSDNALFSQLDGNNHVLLSADSHGGTPTQILTTVGTNVQLWLRGGSDKLLIWEDRDTSSNRCYMASLGNTAARLGRGDECQFASNTSLALLTTRRSAGTTLSVISLDGQKTVTLITDDPTIESSALSPDGSLALAKTSTNTPFQEQLELWNTTDGSQIATSDKWPGIPAFGFAQNGSAFWYQAMNDQNELLLFTSSDPLNAIATGVTGFPQLTSDGQAITYLVQGQSAQELHVYDLAAMTDAEVITGTKLAANWSPDSKRVLFGDLDNQILTLSSADRTGAGLNQLYTAKGVASFQIYSTTSRSDLILLSQDLDGRQTLSLLRSDAPSANVILDSWASLQIWDISADGRYLIVAGSQDTGDPKVLYLQDLMPEGKLSVVDDNASDFLNAGFSRDGRELIYTVESAAQSQEIRRAMIGDRISPEVFLRNAVLLDVQWDGPQRLRWVFGE